jgi:large subunit ribosomal protein L7/L12
MKQAGVLTEEEFAQQKARLFGHVEHTGSATAIAATGPQSASTTYSVVILGCRNKIDAIKGIREIKPHLGLREAKGLVDFLPTILASGISLDDAERMRRRLVAAEVMIEVRPQSA